MLGYGLLCLTRGDLQKDTLASCYRTNDITLCEVTEIGDTTRPWVKAWLTAYRVIHANKTAQSIEAKLIGYVEGGKNIRVGDQLLIGSVPERIKNAGNPGEFDAEQYWHGKGIHWQLFVAKGMYKRVVSSTSWSIGKLGEPLRNALATGLKKHLKDRERAIALALILGDRSELDTETTMSFVNTGAMHVLAVSGLHIGILMSILLFLLARLNRFISRKQATFFVVLLMWLYALITGLSPSVVRAVYMFSVLVLAQVLGRQYRPLNTLFFTAFSLLIFNPFTLFDIGFQLSFLAMLGIYLFYKPISSMFYFEQRVLRWLWNGTAVGFAAQLLTTPISLYYFHQFPNYFVLTNLGLMASTGIILGGGLLLMTCYAVPYISAGIAWLLSSSISCSYWIIETIEKLPGAVAYGFTPNLWWVFLCSFTAIALFYVRKNKWYNSLLFALTLVLMVVLVCDRYKNLATNEFCILSANKTVALVKKSNSIVCFYWCKPNKFKDIQRMVIDYTKIHPGKVRYCSLKKNWDLQTDNKTLAVMFRQCKWGTSIQVNNKEIDLIRNPQFFESSTPNKRVLMPWVNNTVGYPLSSGAFRMKI